MSQAATAPKNLDCRALLLSSVSLCRGSVSLAIRLTLATSSSLLVSSQPVMRLRALTSSAANVCRWLGPGSLDSWFIFQPVSRLSREQYVWPTPTQRTKLLQQIRHYSHSQPPIIRGYGQIPSHSRSPLLTFDHY